MSGSSLAGFSTQALQKELQRREAEEIAEKKRERDLRELTILEHVEGLIELAPQHSFTSCSDKNLVNDDRGCVRCALLRGRETNLFPYTLNLQILPQEDL